MSADEFQEIWKTVDRKLERSLTMNLQLLERVESAKVRSGFRRTIAWKVVTNVLTLPWVAFLGLLVYWHHSEPVFTVSALLLIFFPVHAMVSNIRDIVFIRTIDLSASVTATQERLAVLEARMIASLRLQWLQTPVWAVFFVTKDMILHGGLLFWVIEGVVVLALTAAAIWLYRNISLRNLEKGWVRGMLRNEGGAAIGRARGFIREIEAFKREI